MPRFAACALLVVSVAAASCSNSVDIAPSAPTVATSETFKGALTKNGGVTFPFPGAAGTISATLTTLSPDTTLVVGLSLGTWNGSSCQIVLANDQATQGTNMIGSATTSGNLCVRLYDVGNVTQPETFQVDVVHN